MSQSGDWRLEDDSTQYKKEGFMKYQIIGLAVCAVLVALLMYFIQSTSSMKQNSTPENKDILWEELRAPSGGTYRTKTPDGWLIFRSNEMIYVPDSEHVWLTK